MKKNDTLWLEVERRYKARDKRKRRRMKVSGKSVFTLQRLIDRPKKAPAKKRRV